MSGAREDAALQVAAKKCRAIVEEELIPLVADPAEAEGLGLGIGVPAVGRGEREVRLVESRVELVPEGRGASELGVELDDLTFSRSSHR